MNNQSIALKEFNRITKTYKIQIPEDIKDVTKKLNALGGLLTASDWARAAIVMAWVRPTSGGRPKSDENSSLLTISDFAELGIQGLSTRDAVRHYYNAWKLTKLPIPQKGEIIHLPQIPFPSWSISIDMGGLKLSQSTEWYTPKGYIEDAREVMGSIDLDPASSETANKIVKAKRFISKEDNPDGLNQDWFGNVWLNPPYGTGSGLFTTKLIEEFEAKRINAAILLLNAYGFDNEWFQPLWKQIFCFTDHRIEFWSPDRESGGPANGNIFIYFGSNQEKFARIFSKFGNIACRWKA
jgi:hypothetical protein